MIDKAKNELNGKPIAQWVVWFRTYQGLFKTQMAAAISADATDLPPEMIRPIPVALTEDGEYEEAP